MPTLVEDEEVQAAELAYNTYYKMYYSDASVKVTAFDNLDESIKEAWRAVVITIVEYVDNKSL